MAMNSVFEDKSGHIPGPVPADHHHAEEGNLEYKLVNPTQYRFEHLATQMQWRLQEGRGEAVYQIGVEDNGMLVGLSEEDMRASLNTLHSLAEKVGADITVLREQEVDYDSDDPHKIVEILIRKVPDDQQFLDLRVAVLGNVDSGKSTLLGVLTQGELDNGRGRARLNLFRHLHEIQTGRTSSISFEILGFNSKGEVVNYSESRTAEEICESASKMITFIDLAGHHKYLKTTIFGLTSYCPDFAMLVVSANTGIGK
ncbi:GTP-binding protein 2-like isoform X2 [Hippoglossus stenolepis]|uniref:GTP-binding protein 2-like isoform X2 n=1 Tax=Hippoglossus stenolepis TaxID=195615 RepID=UPI001FB001D6|nr:GTP-binding protein 2-like isoform X2 [Hippoglossus stenolepis]